MAVTYHNLVQGTPDWHAHRARHLNASAAPIMLGISHSVPRHEHVEALATGNEKEITAFMQKIFDDGHNYEAAARPFAEEIIGEMLLPTTASDTIEGLPLSASLDGITMDGRVTFEHKQWSNALSEALNAGVIPDEYHPQMEQGLRITGAERCLFAISRGTKDTFQYLWYEPSDEVWAKTLKGWRQLLEDVVSYEHKPKVVSEFSAQTLPALNIRVSGAVLESNLSGFKTAALKVFDDINTELVTDQDFADAADAVKFCTRVEGSIKAARDAVLAQTGDIDAILKALEEVGETARQKRLKLDRLVKDESTKRKLELAGAVANRLQGYVDGKNEQIGHRVIPNPITAQGVAKDVFRGLKTLASMESKGIAFCIQEEVEIDKLFAYAMANKAVVEDWSLVPDFAQLAGKAPEDFQAVYELRKSLRKEAERQKEEAAEAAKAAAEVARAAAVAQTSEAAPEVKAEVPPEPAVYVDHAAPVGREPVRYDATTLRGMIDAYLENAGVPDRTAVTVKRHLTAFVDYAFTKGE